MNGLPTVSSMARQSSWLRLRVTCRSCLRWLHADLQALERQGKGDVPIARLKFRCSNCGSRRVEAVVEGDSEVHHRPL